MRQEQKTRILYAIAGVIMLIAAFVAALWGLIFQTYSAGPYTPPTPFLYLGHLYLVASAVAIVSGILLLAKKFLWVSVAGVAFGLACGLLSGPIGAYLAFVAFSGGGWWQVFGYCVGSPLIVLSTTALVLTAAGYRKASKLKISS